MPTRKHSRKAEARKARAFVPRLSSRSSLSGRFRRVGRAPKINSAAGMPRTKSIFRKRKYSFLDKNLLPPVPLKCFLSVGATQKNSPVFAWKQRLFFCFSADDRRKCGHPPIPAPRQNAAGQENGNEKSARKNSSENLLQRPEPDRYICVRITDRTPSWRPAPSGGTGDRGRPVCNR